MDRLPQREDLRNKVALEACRAVTLVEVLVVLAIITILTGFVLAGVTAARASARTATCLSHMRQFGIAMTLYAGDYDDRILPNRDGPEAQLGESWVAGWLGRPGPDLTNTIHLQQSLIAPYLNETALWRCPAQEDPVLFNQVIPRVRTLSLNCFMGSPVTSPRATNYRRLADITNPSPSDALTFIDERIDAINDASFGLAWDFCKSEPHTWLLRDKPAIAHRMGANLMFADGHGETKKWSDARTRTAPLDDVVMAGNQDIAWMQRHATWRRDK